jgi:Holliday junction resolvase RusA-like endonuclease
MIAAASAKPAPAVTGNRLPNDQLEGSIVSKNSPTPAGTQPVTVTIGGVPVAKGRPRMTRRGHVYTPAATRKLEAHGRLAAQHAMDDRPPITTPVRLELVVELPVPSSWSKRRQLRAISGEIRPTSRPDIDNYVKTVLDAINTIVIADDSQVVEVAASKKFGVPRMMATIVPLSAESSNRRAAA